MDPAPRDEFPASAEDAKVPLADFTDEHQVIRGQRRVQTLALADASAGTGR